jgi:hypothetical protein
VSQSQANTIAELRAQIAAADERTARVREYWYGLPGHETAEHIGVSVRTLDHEKWAIFEVSQFAGTRVWLGDRWASMFVVRRDDAYQYTLAAAEELAPQLAKACAAAYEALRQVTDEDQAASSAVDDEVERLIDQSRAASPAFVEAVA